jgi:hypothetical protein
MDNEYLNIYNKNKILTTGLIVDTAIYATSSQLGLEIPPGWEEAVKALHEINKEIKEFDKKCWPDIKKAHNEEKVYGTFRYVYENIQMLSMETMGRVLNTISIDNKKKITIMGAASLKNKQKCGLHLITAKKEEAIELIQTIVSHWNPKEFKVHNYNKNLK